MIETKVTYAQGFHILAGDARSQAGTLVVEAGRKVGGPGNRHRGADQWVYVEQGEGEATIAGETYAMSKGSLFLVQRGEDHGFRNTGAAPMHILTFYVPPAYDETENELPAGLP